jgi:hypothetical protein
MSISYKSLQKEKIIELLTNEIKKIEHEIAISELVYSLHGEDTFEDLFRDNIPLLQEKIEGIKLAINNLEDDYDETSSEN